jgi:hypothetical protein
MAFTGDEGPDEALSDGRIPQQMVEEWRRERGTEVFRSWRARLWRWLVLAFKAVIVGFACMIVGKLAASGLDGPLTAWFGAFGAAATLAIGFARLNHLWGTVVLGGGGCVLCIAAHCPNFFPMAGFVVLGLFVSLWIEHDR